MIEEVDRAGVLCLPFQGLMRFRGADVKKRMDARAHRRHRLLHQTSRWSIAEDWYKSGTPGWFADPTQVPGGAFIDEGIYWIDFFRWLSSSEVVQVEAKVANLVHKDIAVEDWGMATFTFANGILATLEASWTINAPRKSGPSPKQNSVVRLEVIGTRGEIIDQWFRTPGRAVLAAGAGDWVFERQSEESFTPASPFPLDHLIECLENETPALATIHDARKSFVAAWRPTRSARKGTRDSVDLPIERRLQAPRSVDRSRLSALRRPRGPVPFPANPSFTFGRRTPASTALLPGFSRKFRSTAS